MVITQLYRRSALHLGTQEAVKNKLTSVLRDNPDFCHIKLLGLETENCFYIQVDEQAIDDSLLGKIEWLISPSFDKDQVSQSSFFTGTKDNQLLIEVGPRLNFSTPLSTNAVSICHSIGLCSVSRIECSLRYLLTFDEARQGSGDRCALTDQVAISLAAVLHDKMTECVYSEPISTFDLPVDPESVYEVDIMGQGQKALEQANADLGLAFDAWDVEYYTRLFGEKAQRNPTSVECFDLAQSNSEHSRHWFFKGRMVIDGVEKDESLFAMVMDTQRHSNDNNVIKFSDNSSAIEGFPVSTVLPVSPARPCRFDVNTSLRHVIFTAETHNFPTGVAPFPGATTGTGGRIRDVQAAGRGAHVIAGTAGYSFGNLHIPGYKLPWEDASYSYPPNFARPLDVCIEASNGASDYGNKFGEPVLTGFARSFGMTLPDGERREWVKPIMFSGGIGSLDAGHVSKDSPEKGMLVVKVGGPVYRIGVGGGAASSIQVQGDNLSELDFGAVQRGDAEMEQKMNRVIRACIEQGKNNPIRSIHDQGAGGNGNVLKEISEPLGAEIKASAFSLADPTISLMELWGAEYQESNALLINADDRQLLETIGEREKCDVSFVGKVSGDGKIRLVDDRESTKTKAITCDPVDLDLELVLGKMPRKVFKLDHQEKSLVDLTLSLTLTVGEALDRVLRLPSVASKRYLTNKVDRSVTGLVAQQQCVGPLHTPLADVAVVALSHYDKVGGATAIGEQPIKGLVEAGCGARMTVGEALTNLVFAQVTDLKDVKCSGNWMWAAKLPGEGAELYDACQAMCTVMGELGVAVDGGKDSLSMAARVGQDTIKAPGTLVVSVYAACPDITATVTPDLKAPNTGGVLLYVPLCPGHHRLGGSALAQCYNQLGHSCPDLQDTQLFTAAFNATQTLIKERLLLAGHDVSDGGLITCLLEMAFAGNCGIEVKLTSPGTTPMEVLFAEELGLVFEVKVIDLPRVLETYNTHHVTCHVIGKSLPGCNNKVSVSVNGVEVLSNKMADLRDIWEATSFQLERLQTNEKCVEQEEAGLRTRQAPPYNLTFDPEVLMAGKSGVSNEQASYKPRVAVIREEGSNGDREMVAAFHMAGFEVWDVNTRDLCEGLVSLDEFRGVVFVGGFSYADVFGSAKGWAATLRYQDSVRQQLATFYARDDTFSLGICNGCQLMALLGWVGQDEQGEQGVHLGHNDSGRFESRFATVRIDKTPAVMLQGMEGSTLGIWVAHGEGKMVFKNDTVLTSVMENQLVPLRFVDDDDTPTSTYPLNPNGSPAGIAGLCSQNGRHLALMPHPERCVLPWQWPWMPLSWQQTMTTSPWLCMFKNAYNWCMENGLC